MDQLRILELLVSRARMLQFLLVLIDVALLLLELLLQFLLAGA